MAERLTARRGQDDEPAEDLAEEPDDSQEADVRPRSRRGGDDDEEPRPVRRSRRRDGHGTDDEAGPRPRAGGAAMMTARTPGPGRGPGAPRTAGSPRSRRPR